jgi:hypothetical protein
MAWHKAAISTEAGLLDPIEHKTIAIQVVIVEESMRVRA